MTIIVEDGTGITGAEAYHDRPFFDDFVSSWGLGDSSSASSPSYEGAARRGTLVFDAVYGFRFNGYPIKYTQGLRFPMSWLVDARGYALPPLPIQVKRAAAALVWYELNNPMVMLPSVVPGKVKKSVVAGPVEVVFDTTAGGAGYISGARPLLAIVEGILSSLGGYSTSGTSKYGSAERG